MKNIDLSKEQLGTKFYTRNYSEAMLIKRIGINLYKLEVLTFNSLYDTEIRIYNRKGNILQADMRRSHPLDLKEKQ